MGKDYLSQIGKTAPLQEEKEQKDTKIVTFRMPEELYQKAKNNSLGVNVSVFIRIACQKMLERKTEEE